MPNETNHFADNIPQEIRDGMHAIARAVKDDFISAPFVKGSWHETLSDARLADISGKAFSGFIPFQDGGFEVSQLYRFDSDTTYHFTRAQSDFMNGVLEDHEKAYCDEKEIDTFDHTAATSEELDAFAESESAWLEDCAALLRFELWAERPERRDHKDHPYFVRVSLGYRDAPYFRAKHDETLFQFSMSESTLKRCAENPQGFVRFLQKKMGRVS